MVENMILRQNRFLKKNNLIENDVPIYSTVGL